MARWALFLALCLLASSFAVSAIGQITGDSLHLDPVDKQIQLTVEDTATGKRLLFPGGHIDLTEARAKEIAGRLNPANSFAVGVDDAAFHLSWDQLSRERLGFNLARHDGAHGGDFSDHAPYYKAQGVKVVYLRANSSDWAHLRDAWLWYGPNGSRVPGVVSRLEVGNEESYQHRTSDPYGAGRAHGAAVRSLKAAVPGAQLICQADDTNRPDLFLDGMRDANPQIAADCHEYSIHPYGPNYVDRMTRARGFINTILGDSTAKFAVTEWGLSVRFDQGCVSDNYGWSTCMSHTEAATRLRDFVAHLKARGDVRFLTIFTSVDHPNAQTNPFERENNFGLLSSHQTGQQAKGAYTTEARTLIAANPFAE